MQFVFCGSLIAKHTDRLCLRAAQRGLYNNTKEREKKRVLCTLCSLSIRTDFLPEHLAEPAPINLAYFLFFFLGLLLFFLYCFGWTSYFSLVSWASFFFFFFPFRLPLQLTLSPHILPPFFFFLPFPFPFFFSFFFSLGLLGCFTVDPLDGLFWRSSVSFFFFIFLLFVCFAAPFLCLILSFLSPSFFPPLVFSLKSREKKKRCAHALNSVQRVLFLVSLWTVLGATWQFSFLLYLFILIDSVIERFKDSGECALRWASLTLLERQTSLQTDRDISRRELSPQCAAVCGALWGTHAQKKKRNNNNNDCEQQNSTTFSYIGLWWSWEPASSFFFRSSTLAL